MNDRIFESSGQWWEVVVEEGEATGSQEDRRLVYLACTIDHFMLRLKTGGYIYQRLIKVK